MACRIPDGSHGVAYYAPRDLSRCKESFLGFGPEARIQTQGNARHVVICSSWKKPLNGIRACRRALDRSEHTGEAIDQVIDVLYGQHDSIPCGM